MSNLFTIVRLRTAGEVWEGGNYFHRVVWASEGKGGNYGAGIEARSTRRKGARGAFWKEGDKRGVR